MGKRILEGKSKYHKDFLESLVKGVRPALGCTEPVAVALAVAKAYEVIGGDIISLKVETSPNIYKNGMGVGIPGTKEIGLVFASALALSCGDANLGLEVFRHVNDEAIKRAEDLIKENIIQVQIQKDEGIFYIKAQVETSLGQGICIIKDAHTNIVYIEANGESLYDAREDTYSDDYNSDYFDQVKIKDIRNFIETVDFEDIEFLLEGVKLNMNMAKVGLEEKPGLALGASMQALVDKGIMVKDLINDVRIQTSAAADARMAGLNIPVMSSAGSGNHGITAIVPPTVTCTYEKCDDEKLARALAFSHLITAYIKRFTGALSPVCGCAVAAGIGASVAVTWILGGNDEQINGAIKNMVGTLAGMVCDGAKGGCAFKLSTASSEAIIQAKLAMENVFINDLDGIVNPNIEETIRNLGRFSDRGMAMADDEIINIMLDHVKKD